MKIFQVDIWEIFLKKFPYLYMKMPSFVIKLLAWFVCQNRINKFFSINANLTGVAFMEKIIKDNHITINLDGIENIHFTDKRRYIFVSNHPLGGLDGICLSAILGRYYNGNIRYLVNDILYFIEPLRDIFIPINRYGRQTKNVVNILNKVFDSQSQVITFPAGMCSRKINGKIMDLEWKKMFVIKAIKHCRDVVPIYFEATNSCLFYTISDFRKRIGIRFNVEMLLLPREMFKAFGSEFTVHFGKPIAWQTFDLSKTALQWANEVKKMVYSMERK